MNDKPRGPLYNDHVTITLNFLRWTVVLNQSGAHITLRSTDLPRATGNPCATMNVDLSCFGDYPWLFVFGVHCQFRSKGRIHLTIHPPAL